MTHPTGWQPLRTVTAWGLSAALLLVACSPRTDSPAPSASAYASSSPSPSAGLSADLALSQDLRDAVDAAAIRDRLEELETIATTNDGIRAAGTNGHDESVDYVAEILAAAGYAVTRHEFTFPAFFETAAPTLAVQGGPAFSGPDHLHALIFSASGEFAAPVAPVALDDTGATIGHAGCDGDDWDGFPEGAIALVGPGGCFTRQKVDAAITAGAVALVAYNSGWEAGQVRRPTLLYPEGVEIPALGASAQVGEALRAAAAAGASVRLSVRTLIEDRVTTNVIAERSGSGPGAVADEVVMVGGHLDSVLDGPGINDNGSGTMTTLELAVQLAELPPTPRTVRVAFWSAEELGLYGSRAWVDEQSADELDRIVAYLNLDMVASPNYARIVYDSADAVAGSDDITAAFGAYFDAVGLTWQGEDLAGGSDHAPFDDAFVPTGGLFSGASERMTDEQAELFGGVAGASLDACYHLACDRTDQINADALGEMADAAAHVLLWLLENGLG